MINYEERIEVLEAALLRADRIIGWMADYIGKMAPPDEGIMDLNEHWLFIQRGMQNASPDAALMERK